uniref:Lipocalin/cytosolic fatty-acid binding domain-containing protein n=1 Tax=Amblyomma maculatum TaxID=34609 RepID=G3MKW7_AMBMU
MHFLIVIMLACSSQAASLDEFREALNTSNPIYLYWQSAMNRHNGWKCVYLSQYQKPENDVYFFQQNYRTGQKSGHTRFTGYLEEGTDQNATLRVMSLYDQQHKKNEFLQEKIYTLRYWNDTEKCFLVSSNRKSGKPHCEVYQWDEIVDKRCGAIFDKDTLKGDCIYRGCELEFQKYCSDPKVRIVYDMIECKNKMPPLPNQTQ